MKKKRCFAQAVQVSFQSFKDDVKKPYRIYNITKLTAHQVSHDLNCQIDATQVNAQEEDGIKQLHRLLLGLILCNGARMLLFLTLRLSSLQSLSPKRKKPHLLLLTNQILSMQSGPAPHKQYLRKHSSTMQCYFCDLLCAIPRYTGLDSAEIKLVYMFG